ncbi:MAG TPA: 2-C-methyl-D-erythritol 4-phosphate cytidylyltransferase [Streptosporangiaceae bacterium]|nr:2-C-methyl-D-erythritol 4-phosphate cytidylyltransferase [Streptosporangiaceae bacterium]
MFTPLAGRPVLEHSVAAFEAAPGVDEIVLVAAPSLASRAGELLAGGGYRKLTRVISDGETGARASRAAIGALGTADRRLVVHDAARPLVSAQVIEDCVASLATCPAVCAVVPAADTMVAVEDGVITQRPHRDGLRRRQTPQGFRLPVLRRAHELALADPAFQPLDDCGVVLRYLPEVPVRLIPGSERNIAITSPESLAAAEALLGNPVP